MRKHYTQVPHVNPAATSLALEEVLRLILCRLADTLADVFAARYLGHDLYQTRANLLVPLSPPSSLRISYVAAQLDMPADTVQFHTQPQGCRRVSGISQKPISQEVRCVMFGLQFCLPRPSAPLNGRKSHSAEISSSLKDC
jgi:hypothetical protein